MPRLRLPNGIEINYRDGGEGPPVVFAHGLAGSADREESWAGLLRDAYHVVTYDARGHAHSTPLTDPGQYTFAAMAADLWGLLDGIGIEEVALFGGSMGAATTLRATLDRPERVAALVQAGPAFAGGPPPANNVFHAFAGLIAQHGLAKAVDVVEEALPDIPEEAIVEMRTRWPVHDEASLVAAMLGATSDAPFDDLAEIEVLDLPVLVIGRDEDPVHPLPIARAYAKRIAGAELVEDDLTQPPLFERPEELAATVRDFLTRAGWR